MPISAVGGDKELMDAMVAAHHVTCGGNVLGSAAAMATLQVIEEEDLNSFTFVDTVDEALNLLTTHLLRYLKK